MRVSPFILCTSLRHPRDGGHPSRIFRRCSAMCRGTPVISAGFQAKIFRMNGHFYFRLQHLIDLIGPRVCVQGSGRSFAHSIGMALLLRIVIIPLFTGNFNISCAVDGTAQIFLMPGNLAYLPMVSPRDPMSDVVAGIIWLLTSGRSLTKQCSYRTSEDVPPSMYIRCTKCPPISALMIIGPSVLSYSPKDGKEIVVSGEKLWVTLYFATLSHG
ncbi:hypothetical protein Tco_0246784 [Tanacetum coccineum]